MVTRAFAVEDGNLNRLSITTSRSNAYSDIDLTFAANSARDVYKKTAAAAVKQSVKNIILTNHFEKPFNPRFGGNIQQMLFELADSNTEFELRENIINSIQRYEPRASIDSLEIILQPDRNDLNVTVNFRVVNYEQQQTIQLTLTRLR
jgi:phage baseplate assembly protein W